MKNTTTIMILLALILSKTPSELVNLAEDTEDDNMIAEVNSTGKISFYMPDDRVLTVAEKRVYEDARILIEEDSLSSVMFAEYVESLE